MSDIDDLRTKLVPFFYFSHPTKGSVTGPWAKIKTSSTRKLALDLAVMMCYRSSSQCPDLATAVTSAVEHGTPQEKAFWDGFTR